MKIYLYIIFLLVFSCTKEVNIKIPQQEVMPVISCIFNPDSLVTVRLSTTQQILEHRDTEITDAFIKLYQNEKLVDTLHYSNDAFVSKIKPQANSNYKIAITTANFSSIISKDKLPYKPIVKPLFYLDSIVRDIDGDMISQAKIKITDSFPEKNYYELALKAKIKNPVNGEKPIVGVFFDTNNDLVFLNEGLMEYYPSELLFSDELFNNETYILTINYGVIFTLLGDKTKAKNYDLIVTVRSVSENYYNYKKTLIKHYNNQEQDIWYGLGAPIPMFTNIENGYGIFAGYNQITDTIYKKK